MKAFRPSCLCLAAWLACSVAASPAVAQDAGSPTLAAVRARGQLACGVDGRTAGFSLPDSRGVMRGIDADYCRALAAAVLGDAGKVRFVPLTAQARFTALQSGEVDVLIRETTWTLTREANLGALFAGINFYDGTAFLVKAGGATSARELDGATVCLQSGTSTELAVGDYFRTQGLKMTAVLLESLNELQQTFLSGRCDAIARDGSALAGFRFGLGPRAGELALLPEVISKEPLGPMVRKGDGKWFDVVRWTHFALLTGEEAGVTSVNADEMLGSTNPDIRRLLGVEGDLGKAMGLDNRWAHSAIKQVGNFGEIWERNITPLGIARGINASWNKGGLMYAPPIR